MRALLRILARAVPALMLLGGAARSQEPPRPSPPQIVTTGQAEIRVTPDRASIRIGVQSRARTAAEASTENNRKQRAVIDVIRARGGAAVENIATTGFVIRPESRLPERPGQSLTIAYFVSNAVVVELNRTELVGEVIDAATGAGANVIHSLSFTLSNPDSARRVAIAQAVARARGDAEASARAAEGTLGALIELTVSDHDGPVVQAREFSVAAAAEGAPVEVGTQSVRASVTARWHFRPAP